MTAYVDTSALLRVILGEPGAIRPLRDYDRLGSSEPIGVESARTIDRLRLNGRLSFDEAAACQRVVADWLEAFDLALLRPPILSRASEPLPTPLGTLDALHLATALVWRDRIDEPLLVATHGVALGTAAQAFGFEVRGI